MATVYSAKKIKYSEKLVSLLESYTGILIVNADNVGSNQIQQIRAALRDRAEILMGKNTQIRRVMRLVAQEFPDLLKLLPSIQGNVGLVFTNENIREVRDVLVSYKVPASAKAGVIAPDDVFVNPGPTGMEPTMTGFFQSLGIATKINRGSIEILSRVHLIKKGEKVGSSETSLLAKLDIKPFSYGLTMNKIYDMGAVYDPEVLDMSEHDLLMKFFNGLSKVAAIGLQLGLPNAASIPHSLINGFRKLVAISVMTDFDFAGASQIKAYLADPSAFAVAEEVKVDDGKPEEVAPEESEESDDLGGGGGLFGDASDDDDSSDGSD